MPPNVVWPELTDPMMDWNDGYHWQWGLAAGLLMLLVWILIIGGIALLVRWLITSRDSARPGHSDAQRVLDDRLARGEISVSEYRERSAALRERDSR